MKLSKCESWRLKLKITHFNALKIISHDVEEGVVLQEQNP